jgi:hypothetical protein
VRVEPASLSTIDIWFNETVDPASAASPAGWRLRRLGQGDVPITAASRDARNGDRVALTAALEPGCPTAEYELAPIGAIFDAAASATGGVANALDLADARNVHRFTLGSTLTVTLGASGHENITISVHDAGMVGPGLSTWSHDAPWLFRTASGMNTGFVRFEWRDRFAAVTGVAAQDAILDASFSLLPEWGDAQAIEIRRVLQSWSDPASGGDWNSNPTGGPTWRDHAHPNARWNQAGAAKLGGSGSSLADYNGPNDLAASVDAVALPLAINERVDLGGAAVTDAFRFWFASPQADYGYALRLQGGATQETKFERAEASLGEHGPVLAITYRLPGAGDCEAARFHRGDPNATGEVDLSDAVFIFGYLFTGGDAPGCLEAADAQNDGVIDISDGIYLLLYLFAGGLEPAPPGPSTAPCGQDPDVPGAAGDLGCDAYDRC